MSTFRRLTNLAKGLVTTEVRKWTEPEAPDLSGEPPARTVPSRPVPADPTPPAVTPPAGPERDEHGEVKRTL